MEKSLQKNHIIIFTDGASRGNPGNGGFGAVLIYADSVIELGGKENNTTNNRMEIKASIEAISKLSKIPLHLPIQKIEIYTDSSYLINGIIKWVNGWQKNGWKTKTKDEVLNRDLWEDLLESIEKLNEVNGSAPEILWKYVGGHIGIEGNERCDEIATAFADSLDGKKEEPKLFSGNISQYNLKNILDISSDNFSLDSEDDFDQEKVMKKARSKAKAYSYVSLVDGVIEIHKSWPECEARVKGARGAKYKKSLDDVDEKNIVKEFSSLL